VERAPAVLTAEIGPDGRPQLLLRLSLPHGWTFGNSFPGLPVTPDRK
jgi:hypothetical protein